MTLVSTNRMVVSLVTIETVGTSELPDLALDLLLQGLETGELRFVGGQRPRKSATSALTAVPRSAARILACR